MNPTQRWRKRIIILLVAALIVGSGLLLVFWLTAGPAPTCTDRIQNQGEAGIDCGGSSCAPCFLQTIAPLKVLETSIVASAQGRTDVLVILKNPNRHAGASRVEYTLTLRDRRGVVGTIESTTFVLPDDRRMVVHPAVAVVRSPTEGSVSIRGIEWQEFDRQPRVQLRVSNGIVERVALSPSLDWRLRGVVQNASSFDLDRIETVGVLRDADGRIVAVGRHEIRTVRSGEERAFEMFWPEDSIGQQPDDVEVMARTNIFENNNILLEYGAGELQPFQQF